MHKSTNKRVMRIFEYMCNFEFTIEHIVGTDNTVADSLSRIFTPDTSSTPHATICAPISVTRPLAIENVEQEETRYDETDIIVPPEDHLLESDFTGFHNGLMGHPGLADTIKLIIAKSPDTRTSDPTLKQRIIALTNQCTCFKNKRHKKKALERRTVSSFKPFETFQADFLTGLPRSSAGNTVLLVFICTFSRFVFLYPTTAETAECAMNGLMQLTGIFGTPRCVVSDGASCFIAKAFEDLCTLLNIKHHVTFPYHPQAHGIVEREHKEILKASRNCFLDFSRSDATNWDHYIPLVNRILNAHTHSATGVSPYELIFGSEQTKDRSMLKTDIPFPERFMTTPTPKDWNPDHYVRSLNNALSTIAQHGLINLEDTILTNYGKSPQTSAEITFKPDDYVLYRNYRITTGTMLKLKPLFCGPVRL
jgi:transposase InsO family protein